MEYDYLPAHQCHASLETKRVGGLFFSGQLNGTTGKHAFRSGAVQHVQVGVLVVEAMCVGNGGRAA